MSASPNVTQWIFLALLFMTVLDLAASHDLLNEGQPKKMKHPRSLEEPSTTSYSLKKCFGSVLDRFQESHSRQKRTGYFTVKFPANTNMEFKWALGLLEPSEPKYKSKLQTAISILKLLPTYMVDDPYTPPFDTLFGGLREEGGPEVREDELILNTDRRKREEKRKQDLHVEERIELYGNFQNMLESYGLSGRDCLLRTVCEVAEAPLQFGVIGNLFNLLFTPSIAAITAASADLQLLDDHLVAERIGRHPDGVDCAVAYAGCPTSVFDYLPIMKTKVISY